MINDNFSLIKPEHYFRNIQRYQFQSLLSVNNKDYYGVLLKDFKKDFYCELVDSECEEENASLSFSDYRSASDYFILDRDDLKIYLEPVLTEFLVDLIYYLDIDESQKFQMVYELLRSAEVDFIVKVKRTPRATDYYPVDLELTEEMIKLIEGYDYVERML